MSASIIVKFGGNLDDLKKALAEGKVIVEQTGSSMDRLAARLKGDAVVREANRWVGALKQIQNITQLSAKDQEKANRVMEAAIGVYQRLGQQVPPEIQKVYDATKQVATASRDAAKAHETHGLGFGKMVGAYVAGLVSIGAATRAMRGLVTFITSSLDAYAEQELATKKLTAAMVAQGTAAPALLGHYQDLASQFQRTTVYGDELTLQMEALLIQVGDVAPQQMEKALRAAMDLASGLGVDLETATLLVGKAFAGETGTLKRYGIVIDEVKLKAGGITAVLDAIQDKFGGQAAAEVDTYSGKVKQLANEWGDLKEEVGGAIAAMLTASSVLSSLTDLTRGAKTVAARRGAFGGFTDAVALFMQQVLSGRPAGVAWGDVARTLAAVGQTGAGATLPGAPFPLPLPPPAPLTAEQRKAAAKAAEDAAKASVEAWDVWNEMLRHLATKTHAIALKWQDEVRQAGLAVAQIRNQEGVAAMNAYVKYAEKNAVLLRTDTEQRVALIKAEHAGVLADLRSRFGEESVIYQMAKIEIDKFYQHEVDLAEETSDTIVERMKRRGVLTRRDLEETASLARREYAQMKASGVYTADALAAAAKRVQTAERAARGETVEWGKALSDLSQAFAQLAQIGEGSLGRLLEGIGKSIGSANLLLKGIEAVNAGLDAMETAQTTAQKIGAGLQTAGGAASILGVMLEAYTLLNAQLNKAKVTLVDVRNATSDTIKALVSQQGGLENLTRQMKLLDQDWLTWVETMKQSATNVDDVAAAFDLLGEKLAELQARQRASATAVQLTGQLVSNWITPIREASEGLKQAQAEYEGLAAVATTDPLRLAEAQQKVTAFQAILQDLGRGSQQAFASMTAYTVASFAAVLKTTGDFGGALAAVGPLLDDLAEGQRTFGLEAGAAVTELLKIRGVQREFKALLEPISLGTQIVRALGQSGLTSGEALNALGRDARTAYDAMIAGGTDARMAMVQLQSPLQALWEAWKTGKVAIDAETVALLQQAEAGGLVGDEFKSINDQLLASFKELKTAIEAMTYALIDFSAAGGAIPRPGTTTPAPGTGARSLPPGYAPPAGTSSKASWWERLWGHGARSSVFGLPLFHQGGFVSTLHAGASLWAAGQPLIRAHRGLVIDPRWLAPDDVPIIAQRDEGLLSRDVGMPSLGRWALAAMNRGLRPPTATDAEPGTYPTAIVIPPEQRYTVRLEVGGRHFTDVVIRNLGGRISVAGGRKG